MMAHRKKSREEWEQEVRERQYNVDPMDRIRTIRHISRSLPEGTSFIRGKRELTRAILGLLLCMLGLAVALIAYGGSRSVFPSPWLAVAAFGLGVLLAGAGVFLAVSAIK